MTWDRKKAVVTGACGFIGSHLVEALARRGTRVKALTFYDARGGLGWMDDCPADVRDAVEIVPGDVRDTESMRRLIAAGEAVFHLAALIGIPYSYQAPRSYIDTNITGTLNVLEACRAAGAGPALVISTSEVYGSARQVPIPETHPLQGQSPYAASKIAAEKLAESYHLSFALPVIMVRPFNTYGPRQSPRAVIPTILMQALSGQPELALGDWSTTRDFNYVADTVEGMIRLAECEGAIGRTVNIGTGSETSIQAVAAMTRELTGQTLALKADPQRLRPPASEVRRLCADAAQLEALTGWKPPARLKEGLTLTLAWMRKHLDRYNSQRYYV